MFEIFAVFWQWLSGQNFYKLAKILVVSLQPERVIYTLDLKDENDRSSPKLIAK